jgi:hypothetical protein
LFVIGIHVVWSITVPIALTESAFPAGRDVPWLGNIGLTLYAIVLLVGFGLVATFSYKQSAFMATPLQFGVVGALIVALCMAASRLPKRKTTPSPSAPHAITLFFVSFVLGSVFMLIAYDAATSWHWSWPVAVASLLAIEVLFVAFVIVRRRAGAWNEAQRFALMAGALLVYVWRGFGTDLRLHGAGELVGHSILAALACVLLVVIGMRTRRLLPC